MSIILVRLLIENWLQDFRFKSGLYIFYQFTHTLLFFLSAYLLFVFTLSRLLKTRFRSAANVMLYGHLIILAPPLLDHIISSGNGFWSFYKFDSLAGLLKRFLTFFGDKPDIGITYGVRIEVALALFFIFIYSFIKTYGQRNFETKYPVIFKGKCNFLENYCLFKNLKLKIGNSCAILLQKIFLYSIFVTLVSYAIFFVLGTFPSWIAIAIDGFTKGFFNVTEINTAQMFLSPAIFFSREIPDIVSALNIKMSFVYALFLTLLLVGGSWIFFKKKFLAIVKNARPPQLLYHSGLLAVGLALGIKFSGSVLTLSFFNILSFLLLTEAVWLAWLASVVANDIQDQEIDAIANADRPLIKKVFTIDEYKTLGWIFFFGSLLFSAIVNFKVALLLLVYQAVAWIYSGWPLRLKRFPIIATFASSIASLLILFSGFILVAPNQNISQLPAAIIWLLAISYTLSLPLKDFKDIAGDKKDGVYTIPVLFGEQWGKIIVGSGVFISYLLSVVLLNEPRLFWWAFLGGSISFWLINQMQKPSANRWLNYRNIFWWILGIISAYGLVLIKIIFL